MEKYDRVKFIKQLYKSYMGKECYFDRDSIVFISDIFQMLPPRAIIYQMVKDLEPIIKSETQIQSLNKIINILDNVYGVVENTNQIKFNL